MGRTSIPCSEEVREQLTERKQNDETWNDCLGRLMEGMPAEDEDTAAVLERLDELEELMEDIDVGDGGSPVGGPEINELREVIRMEVRNVMDDTMSQMAR